MASGAEETFQEQIPPAVAPAQSEEVDRGIEGAYHSSHSPTLTPCRPARRARTNRDPPPAGVPASPTGGTTGGQHRAAGGPNDGAGGCRREARDGWGGWGGGASHTASCGGPAE